MARVDEVRSVCVFTSLCFMLSFTAFIKHSVLSKNNEENK